MADGTRSFPPDPRDLYSRAGRMEKRDAGDYWDITTVNHVPWRYLGPSAHVIVNVNVRQLKGRLPILGAGDVKVDLDLVGAEGRRHAVTFYLWTVPGPVRTFQASCGGDFQRHGTICLLSESLMYVCHTEAQGNGTFDEVAISVARKLALRETLYYALGQDQHKFLQVMDLMKRGMGLPSGLTDGPRY